MRSRFVLLGSLLTAACAAQPTGPATPTFLRSGTFRYEATTVNGEPLLSGRIHLEIREDSTIVGTWTIRWVPGADTTMAVGSQIGSGAVYGRQSGHQVFIDLNPGYVDNNVGLAGESVDGGLAGTWEWSTIAGPTTRGLFTASN